MLNIDLLQRKFKHALEEVDFGGQPTELYAPIAYMIELGGKRMRPVMALLACDMFGGAIDNAMPAAIAVEIFHNFTLVHDDIMDKAPLRRGRETVYKRWNTNIAILAGDTMLAKAYEFINKTDPKYLSGVMEQFTKTAIAVCEGQQYDMNFERKDNISIADYLMMIRLKTAVLTGASMKIGAIIAGAPKKDLDEIFRFGENLGIAFQLKDDLLDAFGDEKKFGKKIGGDIVENKKTYLHIRAHELAKGETLNALKYYFVNSAFDDDSKVASVMEIYHKLKIKEQTEKEIDKFYNSAMTHLKAVKLPEESKEQVRLLAQKIRIRES